MTKSDDHVTELLRRVDLFEGLSAAELRRVREAGKEVDFSAGEELTEQGREGGRFYLILDGTVDITVHGQPAHSMGPGEYLGEVSLIDGLPRSASARATTAVRTWSLASFAFRPILHEYPAMADKLLVLFCRRLREAEARLASGT